MNFKEVLESTCVHQQKILTKQFNDLKNNQCVGKSTSCYENTTEGEIPHTTFHLEFKVDFLRNYKRDINKLRMKFMRELKNYIKENKFIARIDPVIAHETNFEEDFISIRARIGICPFWTDISSILNKNRVIL